MATGNTTTTDLEAYIAEVVNPQIQKTFFDRQTMIPLLTEDMYNGDTTYRWPVKSAGNSSSTLTNEGEARPASGKGVQTRAAASFQTVQTAATVTGEAISAMKNGIVNDALRNAIQEAMDAHMKKEDDYAEQEIIDGIDDDTTVYGLTRATYNFDSYVVEGGTAALTEAMLGNAFQSMVNSPRDVPASEMVMFSAWDQKRRYSELAGGQYGEINRVVNINGNSFDLGRMAGNISYNGVPWLTVTDLTNTYVFFSRLSDMRVCWKAKPNVELLGKTGYWTDILITSELAVRHANPHKAARIEALTAYSL